MSRNGNKTIKITSGNPSGRPWPHAKPTLQQITDAGFTLGRAGKIDDEVKCYSCGIKVSDWKYDSDPLEEHRRASDEGWPTLLKCPFLRSLPSSKPPSNTYIFDPDGDVRLIIKQEDLRPNVIKLKVPSKYLHALKDFGNIFEGRENAGKELHASLKSTDNSKLDVANSEIEIEPSRAQPSQKPTKFTEDIFMLVSSRHLMLASPVFKAMLQPRFAEGLALKNDGKVDIELYDDDCAALEIFLNVIHGHTRKLPKALNLQMFTILVVLVDKYQTHEVIETYTNMWFDEISYLLPVAGPPTQDLYPWLCVCWVLGKEKEFDILTFLAKHNTIRRIDQERSSVPADLPVPISVIDAIAEAREYSLGGLIYSICDHVNRYAAETHKCQQKDLPAGVKDGSCDLMTYGYMTKHLAKYGLWPMPNAPYEGLSMYKVSEMILKADPPSFCYEIEKMMDRVGQKQNRSPKSCQDMLRDLRAFVVQHEGDHSMLLYRNFVKGGDDE